MIRNMSILVTASMLIGLATLVGMAQPTAKTQLRDIASLRSAFQNILSGTEKAGGSVLVEKACNGDKTVVQPEQSRGSTEDPFDFLTKTNPDYRIFKEPESVDLLPANYEPEILKTQINYYLIDSGKSAPLVLQEILALDELRGGVDAALLNKGLQINIGPSSPPLPGPSKFKQLYSVTLRQALNDIAVFYRNGIWAYTENRCDGKVRSSLSFVKG